MRKSYKVGTVAFALLALGVAMTHASMTACTSKNTSASPEPTAPAANAKSSPPPSAQPAVEYFPASKSGGFMPSKRREQK
jgi:hypothetical protein